MSLQKLKINPEYDKLIPPLPKSDYDELKKSIQTDGLYHGITVNEKNEILDGHHRYKACQDLGIKFRTDVKKFDSQFAEKRFVIKSNFTRRHLEIYQRAALADELHKLDVEEGKQKVELDKRLSNSTRKDKRKNRKQIRNKPAAGVYKKRKTNKSRERAAKQSNLSDETLRKYQHVLYKSKNPDLKTSMTKGLVSINEAYNIEKKMEDKQKLLAAKPLISLPENCDLRLGDFIEQSENIPDDSIDLIFTDPPYDVAGLPLYEGLGILAQRVLRKGGSLVTFAGAYALPETLNLLGKSGLKYWWQIIVEHSGKHAQMFQRGVYVKYKPLLWFVKGDKRMAGLDSLDDLVKSTEPDKTTHEWAQSTVEAEHVISKLTIGKNQVVFDPFMGDGTTGIAALNLKRKFIGIEVDKTRFDNATRNIIGKTR